MRVLSHRARPRRHGAQAKPLRDQQPVTGPELAPGTIDLVENFLDSRPRPRRKIPPAWAAYLRAWQPGRERPRAFSHASMVRKKSGAYAGLPS